MNALVANEWDISASEEGSILMSHLRITLICSSAIGLCEPYASSGLFNAEFSESCFGEPRVSELCGSYSLPLVFAEIAPALLRGDSFVDSLPSARAVFVRWTASAAAAAVPPTHSGQLKVGELDDGQ
jgi:hypothetical protein